MEYRTFEPAFCYHCQHIVGLKVGEVLALVDMGLPPVEEAHWLLLTGLTVAPPYKMRDLLRRHFNQGRERKASPGAAADF